MKTPRWLWCLGLLAAVAACKRSEPGDGAPAETEQSAPAARTEDDDGFAYTTGDRFGDSAVLRYRVPGFESLPLETKKLLYFLSEAALSGRDIAYDQKYRYNLAIRRTLEALIEGGRADPDTEEGRALRTYAKKVWFAGGIHHDYASDKFVPGFSAEWFAEQVKALPKESLPLADGESVDQFLAKLNGPIFDPEVDARRVEKAADKDPVADSAVNFYAPGITQAEVEAFYGKMKKKDDPTPVSYGLNSKLVKEDGELKEKVWKLGGMYGPAIEEIVGWLERAIEVAENDEQRVALQKLVAYYRSGDLADFDAYNVAWVNDTDSMVDTINGFIEVYNDAMAYKGTYEAVVSFRDPEATKRIATLADQAQWFEDNAPYLPAHKKAEVKGISAKVITVVMEAGDAAPTTPIGINLPNSNWIRARHGSKSVTIGNIIHAYNAARRSAGTTAEFSYDETVAKRLAEHGALAYDLKVDLHEVIGHASGKLEDGVGTPKETLKTYSSTLEEARADLVALYFIADPKLEELGLVPSMEVGKAGYDQYIQNGLMKQLNRIEKGKDIEEAHMRNRQMIAMWAYEKGKPDDVIEKKTKDGKTYFVINDYAKLRDLFGQLLKEVQRIKSQGDYEAGKALIETYGVKIDPELHAEVLARYAKLDLPSYYGFIQPRIVPVKEDGAIVDVRIEYPEDFTEQQLRYAREYSFLPTYN